jgi:(1->4)-alpha-D-glucan 1-alpha-D-glucosylmutase
MLFLQNLIGAWPADPEELPPLSPRLAEYLIKAAKEAKVNTSWIQEDRRWEDALRAFVEGFFALPQKHAIWKILQPFAQRISEIGLHNSLSQLILKVASPGVPDFYQGCELWDLSLVDPDNRRPVDFALRRGMLNELRASALAKPQLARSLYEKWEDGRIKLFVTNAALLARRENAQLFQSGVYQPLAPQGARAPHVVAFARAHGQQIAVAAVPRLVSSLLDGARLKSSAFEDTYVPLPGIATGTPLRDALTGEERVVGPRGLSAEQLFSTLPVALLLGRH